MYIDHYRDTELKCIHTHQERIVANFSQLKRQSVGKGIETVNKFQIIAIQYHTLRDWEAETKKKLRQEQKRTLLHWHSSDPTAPFQLSSEIPEDDSFALFIFSVSVFLTVADIALCSQDSHFVRLLIHFFFMAIFQISIKPFRLARTLKYVYSFASTISDRSGFERNKWNENEHFKYHADWWLPMIL